MKTLISQIFNEWRINLWLALELLIVSVVMWYIVDYFYSTVSIVNTPKGFDAEHCYRIDFSWLGENSADYKADKDNDEARAASLMEMLERLKRRPEIEAVSLSHASYPYNGSNSSTSVAVDSVVSTAYALRRYVTPDFVRVFRYEGTNGETPERLAELLKDPHNILASDNLFHQNESKVNASSFVNKTVILGGDSTNTATIAAALNVVRYSEYTPAEWSKSITRQIPEELVHYANELCVRVKENMDVDFAENLKADSESQLRVDNLFIADVISFDRIRHSYQLAQDRKLRDYTIGMLFLLINIFLGLLGTFWFRTQQRVGEIAVRKVSGATRRDIFARLIGEGLLLLTAVTVVALAVDINLAYMEFNTNYGGSYLYWPRVLTAAGVAYVLMMIMVISGIYFPARRAMKVEPAEVLRDE